MDNYEKSLLLSIEMCDLVINNRKQKGIGEHYQKAIETKKDYQKRLEEYRGFNTKEKGGGF